MIALRLPVLLFMLAGLAGCATTVHRVAVDPARLAVPVAARLACEYRLHDVVDARSSSERSGGLGKHLFLFDDVPGVVRQEFDKAGFGVQSHGPSVDVRILQFYLAQNTITKVPVAVYEVRVDGGAPFLVRSQKTSMNWNGTENEAYQAYAAVLADAARQVVARLNNGCAKAG